MLFFEQIDGFNWFGLHGIATYFQQISGNLSNRCYLIEFLPARSGYLGGAVGTCGAIFTQVQH